MASSLSNLVNNLAERIHNIKCTNCNTFCLQYKTVKEVLIEYKCLCCSKNQQKIFYENLKKRFAKTHTYTSHDINKLGLLLQKIVYSY